MGPTQSTESSNTIHFGAQTPELASCLCNDDQVCDKCPEHKKRRFMAKHHGMDPNRYVVRAGKKDRKSDSDLSVRERKMLMNDLRRKLSARLGRKVSKSEMEDLLRAETNKIKLAQTNS